MDQMLEDIDGAVAIMDDILIAAIDVETHDRILSKFFPQLSTVNAPIRELLKEENEFSWEKSQEKAFEKLKAICCNLPVLKYFDVNEPIEIQSDASQFALGAVLLQNGKPIAYASRSLTETYQVRPFWDSRSELAVVDGIIYKGLRIVVPPSLQNHMLKIIHDTHLGIVKCKQRAREALYWPAMNTDIEENIKNCSKCADYGNNQQFEHLKPTELHDYPFYEAGCDLFEFESKNYLILVDYYSKFIEVNYLKNITTKAVIEALKSQFARHGIPKILRSDCGSQFLSQEFKQFCLKYDIILKPSSPHYHRSNGEAERAVQTVKQMWRKNEDKHMALLNYRTTPLEGINLSPAQLLTGRRFRNTMPISDDLLKPTAYNQREIKQRFLLRQNKQKFYHDKPSTKSLEPLQSGEMVRMAPLPGTKLWKPAVVVNKHQLPRSYVVESNGTKYRRNRNQIKRSTALANQTRSEYEPEIDKDFNFGDSAPMASQETVNKSPTITTRSGRVVKPPKRLDL